MFSQQKLFDTICVEIRPRLRSVNVFVQLKHNHCAGVKVILNNNSFTICKGELSSVVDCAGLDIDTKSLSSIRISGQSLSFRCSTNNKLGNLKAELLVTNKLSENSSIPNNQLFLFTNKSYEIQCSNCKRALSETVNFVRVLPLPSLQSDPSDWFCHDHGGNSSFSLEPKESDIFYTSCYCHCNRSILKNIRSSGKVIVCQSCLNWLGVHQDKESYRLWFHSVQFLLNSHVHTTNPLTDFLQTIREIAKDAIFDSLKVILTAQTTSDKSDTLLIWILERKLSIRFTKDLESNTYEVAKVLFKYVKEDDLNEYQQWVNDQSTYSGSISKMMCVEGLKHLHFFNKIFPKDFSTSNNFLISYLFMYEPF